MRMQDKTRLTKPLVRSNGQLREVSWNEALDNVAESLRASLAKRDPSAFGMLSCSKSTNELNYVAQKFTRVVIGSNNVDSCNRA